MDDLINEPDAEEPAVTQQRLDIGPERLLHYLTAFGRQLDAALAQLAADGKAPAAPKDARLWLDNLHIGCITLGLWSAGAALDALRGAAFDSGQMAPALALVARAAAVQADRVKSTLPAAVPPP